MTQHRCAAAGCAQPQAGGRCPTLQLPPLHRCCGHSRQGMLRPKLHGSLQEGVFARSMEAFLSAGMHRAAWMPLDVRWPPARLASSLWAAQPLAVFSAPGAGAAADAAEALRGQRVLHVKLGEPMDGSASTADALRGPCLMRSCVCVCLAGRKVCVCCRTFENGSSFPDPIRRHHSARARVAALSRRLSTHALVSAAGNRVRRSGNRQRDAATAAAVRQPPFCYVVHTSGSTGQPLGVCGSQAGASRFL